MSDMPLHWLSINNLSKRILSRSLSPVTLMEHFLDRAESLNETLGAFQLIPREQALNAARSAELALQAGHYAGPLHGIPFAAKDIIDVSGLPTTAGSSKLSANIAKTDATVVERLRKAGMVLLGKTKTVQFAMGAPGINRDLGTPKNPWSPIHHVPGGSSSGSAVAVAAGLVPMALGTDTGGSVRIPASLCGTVGLKPTVSQVSRAGVFPISETLDSVGPLTKSVEGAAWVYQALHGADVRDRHSGIAQGHNVIEVLKNGATGLRIAVADNIFKEDLDAEVESAIDLAIGVFVELGAHVETIAFSEAGRALEASPRLLISSVEGALAHEKLLPDFDSYDETLKFRLAEGRNAYGVDYLRARQACIELAAEAEASLRDFDVFISATTPSPAKPLDEVDGSTESYQHWNTRYSRNTVIGNLLGMCAVSLPCGFSSNGLPIGLMVHAPARGEETVLRAAYAFEQATKWHEKLPKLAQVD